MVCGPRHVDPGSRLKNPRSLRSKKTDNSGDWWSRMLVWVTKFADLLSQIQYTGNMKSLAPLSDSEKKKKNSKTEILRQVKLYEKMAHAVR